MLNNFKIIIKSNVFYLFVFLLSSSLVFAQNPNQKTKQNTEKKTDTKTQNQDDPENLEPVDLQDNIYKKKVNQDKLNRNLGNDDDARNINLTDQELKTIAREDSIRNERLEEEIQDGKKQALKKRIYGYSLFSNVVYDANAKLNIAAPGNYVLGPNDGLVIDVYGYEQAQFKEKVDVEGYISFPRVGLVKVGGYTLDEASEKIKSALSKAFFGLRSNQGYKPNTFVKVSLGTARAIRVNFTGEVVAPGTYTVSSLTSVINALYVVGGPNEIGTYRKIKVIRNNKEIVVLDLYEYLINGFTKSDILLKDQDVIHVGPYISRVSMEGNLKRKGLFEITEDENLLNAISFAGGFDQNAYKNRLKIYRNTSLERKILEVDQVDFGNFKIMNGDSIFVERILDRYENMVSIEGAVFRPGEYSLDSNPTLMDLIRSADGLKGDAFQGRVSIIRTNDDLTYKNISVNIEDIRKGVAADIALKREDLVHIYSMYDLSQMATIKIQGAINNPMGEEGLEIPFIRNMTVEDVIVSAGGLTDGSSISNIEVVRRKKNIDPRDVSAEISDIYRISISPDLTLNSGESKFILQPFDEIIVRSSPNYTAQKFITIEGEVIFPGKYGIFKKDEKLSDVIKRAGGITSQAYLPGATLIRPIALTEAEIDDKNRQLMELANPNSKVELITAENKNESIGISLDKILKDPNSLENITLQDGDIIRIPKQLETVKIQGEVLYPITSKYLPSKKFIDYISSAGGLTKKSQASKAYIIYPNGSVDRTRRFLFANIYPSVQPGSEIIIPAKEKDAQQQLANANGILTTIMAAVGSIVTILGILRLTK